MKLDARTTGGLAAAGGAIFIALAFGAPRLGSLVDEWVRPPHLLFDCCSCFGIVALVLPLGLLALALMRKPPDAPR
ncbi:MAG: hypothetical protein KF729_18725 [Sandaracinaceae bacterium]|nr:hypothetical protein [Sandaracinaceae bacterium]